MTKDNVLPLGKWEFDETVTNCFDDMLQRSIPNYNTMREACYQLACKYVQSGTNIVDLGISTGDAIAKLLDKYGAHNRFIGLEISDPMLEACRERFKGYINCGVVDIRKCDLRQEFPPVSASVIQSILTVQFTPIEYRQRIIQSVYDALIKGGAFIYVEKVLGATNEIDTHMVDIYYALKRANGYTQDQIDRKRLSLEGALVPLTAAWNEDLLRAAGFKAVDCFWRWMNFAGWVAVK